jgi:hypothetical protein
VSGVFDGQEPRFTHSIRDALEPTSEEAVAHLIGAVMALCHRVERLEREVESLKVIK